MRSFCLAALTAFVLTGTTPPSLAQDGVSDFDWDCLSNPIASSSMLQGCALMVVEIAELENASPDVVSDRIQKTADNARAGGGARIIQDACGKTPLASYRGGTGSAGQMYEALCTNF